jgi:hypothetical protein
MDAITLPAPRVIIERINLCRDELSQLKKLLRASEAAAKAEEARQWRQANREAVAHG